MADKFRKLVPGDLWKINSELNNLLVEMAHEYEARRSLSQQGLTVGGADPLRILNLSPDTVAKYGVVGLGAPITPPAADLPEFKDRKGFESVGPLPTAPFAILQEPIDPETIGDALAQGVTQCLIDMTDAGHGHALPIADDYAKLLSSAAPTRCEIIWADTIPAAARAEDAVLTSDIVPPESLDGDDGDYWEDAEAEEWYGPKSAGAWGSGHPFGTGVVWAVVGLAGLTAAITSLNGDETPAQDIALGIAGDDINIATTAVAWSSTQQYQTGWGVSHEDFTYRALVANLNVEPGTDPATWQDITGHGLVLLNLPPAGADDAIWAKCRMSGSNAIIRSSKKISSVERLSAGKFEWTFDVDFLHADSYTISWNIDTFDTFREVERTSTSCVLETATGTDPFSSFDITIHGEPNALPTGGVVAFGGNWDTNLDFPAGDGGCVPYVHGPGLDAESDYVYDWTSPPYDIVATIVCVGVGGLGGRQTEDHPTAGGGGGESAWMFDVAIPANSLCQIGVDATSSWFYCEDPAIDVEAMAGGSANDTTPGAGGSGGVGTTTFAGGNGGSPVGAIPGGGGGGALTRPGGNASGSFSGNGTSIPALPGTVLYPLGGATTYPYGLGGPGFILGTGAYAALQFTIGGSRDGGGGAGRFPRVNLVLDNPVLPTNNYGMAGRVHVCWKPYVQGVILQFCDDDLPSSITFYGGGFDLTPANNVVNLASGTCTCVASTENTLTVEFDTPPTVGFLFVNVRTPTGDTNYTFLAQIHAGGSPECTFYVKPVLPFIAYSDHDICSGDSFVDLAGLYFDNDDPANNTVVLNRGAAGTVALSSGGGLLRVTLTTPPSSSGALTAIITNRFGTSVETQIATVTSGAAPTVTVNSGVESADPGFHVFITFAGTNFSNVLADNVVTTSEGTVTVMAASSTSLKIMINGFLSGDPFTVVVTTRCGGSSGAPVQVWVLP